MKSWLTRVRTRRASVRRSRRRVWRLRTCSGFAAAVSKRMQGFHVYTKEILAWIVGALQFVILRPADLCNEERELPIHLIFRRVDGRWPHPRYPAITPCQCRASRIGAVYRRSIYVPGPLRPRTVAAAVQLCCHIFADRNLCHRCARTATHSETRWTTVLQRESGSNPLGTPNFLVSFTEFGSGMRLQSACAMGKI